MKSHGLSLSQAKSDDFEFDRVLDFQLHFVLDRKLNSKMNSSAQGFLRTNGVFDGPSA